MEKVSTTSSYTEELGNLRVTYNVKDAGGVLDIDGNIVKKDGDEVTYAGSFNDRHDGHLSITMAPLLTQKDKLAVCQGIIKGLESLKSNVQ